MSSNFAAHHRRVAGVILDSVLLFEAGLVRLVDDDQAEASDRAGTSAERAPTVTLASPAGDCRARPGGALRSEVRMPGDGRAAEPRFEAFEERLGQRDLGKEDERLLSLAQAFGDRFEIDFGLARAGDAVEQDRIETLADALRPGSRRPRADRH